MKSRLIIIVALAGILVLWSSGFAESPSVLLEKGIYNEETTGNLDAAIKIYQQIVDDSKANHKYVAEAQYRLGLCFMKQKENAKAVATFRKLIKDFSDQKKFVAKAKNHISKSRKRISGPELTKIVKKAVLTISTCAETDPRVKKSLASLEGLNEQATVKAVAKFLNSDKNTVRRSAIYILWKGPFKTITPAVSELMKLCKHKEGMTRGMAALTLGGRKIGSAFQIICDMTLDDKSPYARRCAAYALGLLGNPAAKPTLEKALNDKNEMVSNNAEAALAMLDLSEKKAASQPATRDQVIVEDLALEMLVAIREKDNAKLKAMSVDRIKGWRDAWPHFSLEMRERFTQITGKPFTMYPDGSIVSGDIAAVKCIGPKELKGIYLILFFVKTDSGWKNFSIRNSPPSVSIETHLRKAAQSIGVRLAAVKPPKKVLRLLYDDCKSIGMKSIGGSGHGVKFGVPADGYKLTSVKLFGSRYGRPKPPKENFNVWLCDTNYDVLAKFSFPYSKFKRGKPRWITLPVKPTAVPKQFVIFFGFNPGRTKGVYVHYSARKGNNSFTGLPGGEIHDFDKGNWMIRAIVKYAGGAKTSRQLSKRQLHYRRKLLDAKTLADVKKIDKMFASWFRPEGRYEAASKSEKAAMVQQWIIEAESANFKIRTRAIAALGNVRDPQAVDVLIRIADEPMRNNRPKWLAVRGLGEIGDPKAVPTLIELVDYGNWNTNVYARASLAQITEVYFGTDKAKWRNWWKTNGKAFVPKTDPKVTDADKLSAAKAARASESPIRIRFNSPEVLNDFYTKAPDAWRVEDGKLIGTGGGRNQKCPILTYNTHFKKISKVAIKGSVAPPAKLPNNKYLLAAPGGNGKVRRPRFWLPRSSTNFRVGVGTVNLIFNWELRNENHYRNGEKCTVQKNHALTPGKEHIIVVEEVRGRVVVSVDGKQVYSTKATLDGTVTVYPAHGSVISVSEIDIIGVPDFGYKVRGHSHKNTY